MKTHISAGGVLHSPLKDKFYLIYKRERDEWLLPKGHIEQGEDIEEVALREIAEETGYKNIEFMKNPLLGKTEFEFDDADGKKALKIIYYYLAKIKNEHFKETVQRKKEGLSGAWLSFGQALSLIAHEDARNILKKARKICRKS